ncbi:hypothetical protein [Virgisporangium ochraceum]|uniref:hypothetical protein n=1 Tax=Virgisporangium ochraceum TaxID=65505 RepID=UPI0019456DC7|nr:hypothetical protein [Virgisporangium ochraceum]
MTHTAVTHTARVAWDGALAIVGAAHFDDLYGWLAPTLGDLLGAEALRAFAETRYLLRYSARPDAPHVEAGRWRARLEDLVDRDPALAAPVRELAYETRLRLRELVPPLTLAS